MALAALPRRDAAAREHLDNLGRQAQPVVLARDRAVGLSGDLGELIPGGALVRGIGAVRRERRPGSRVHLGRLRARGRGHGGRGVGGRHRPRRHPRRARGARGGGDARSVRGGPAGAPRPLGHRGRGAARRREPRDGRGASAGSVPRTHAGWWRVPASATRSSWCARRRVGGRPAPRSRSAPRAARGSVSTTPAFSGAAPCTCTSRGAARPRVRTVRELARAV